MGFTQDANENGNVNGHVKTISAKVQSDADRSMKAKASGRERFKKNLKKIILVLTLGYVSFTSYSCYSLPAPFLPREAEKKGLTPFEYGIIFASYEVVRLFMSPICSAIVSLFFHLQILESGNSSIEHFANLSFSPPQSIRMTPKVFLMTGIFIKSFCTPLFGLCSFTRSPKTFFICSLIVRMVSTTPSVHPTLGALRSKPSN